MKILRFIGLLLIFSPALWAQESNIYGKEDSKFVWEEEPQDLEADNLTNAELNDSDLLDGQEDNLDSWTQDEEKTPVQTQDSSAMVQSEQAMSAKSKPASSNQELAQPRKTSPLVEAYYAVGEQYEKKGKKKGASYKIKALKMSPDYTPTPDQVTGSKSIQLSPRSQAEQESNLTAEIISTSKGTDSKSTSLDEATQVKIVRLQFDRFMRNLLAENLTALESLMAPVVQLNDQELEKSDLIASLDLVFQQVNLMESSFKDLYLTNAKEVSVTLVENGGIVKLEAKEREDLKGLPFWKKNQEFYFSLVDGKWLLSRIVAGD